MFLLLETQVAGLAYAVKREDLDAIKEGEPVLLVREPKNEHDKNAVRVDTVDGKIGYIPRNYAMVVAALLDNGYKLTTVVGDVVPAKGICTVIVKMQPNPRPTKAA